MKKSLLLPALLLLGLALAGCGTRPAQPTAATSTLTAGPAGPTTVPSATPDLCTADQMPKTVAIVNTYVRQFDNYSSLSVQVPPAQLPQVTASMKAIRQALADQLVPSCLTQMKHYALQYMDTVIVTVVTYQANPNVESLNTGILQARQYNDQYAGELARLLGVTLAPESETPQPANETPTPAVTTVINPGPNPLNLHVAPSLTSESIAMLNANESATAIGKSSNGEWIQIEVPGRAGAMAWVYASLVQYVSGDASVLPVATP